MELKEVLEIVGGLCVLFLLIFKLVDKMWDKYVERGEKLEASKEENEKIRKANNDDFLTTWKGLVNTHTAQIEVMNRESSQLQDRLLTLHGDVIETKSMLSEVKVKVSELNALVNETGDLATRVDIMEKSFGKVIQFFQEQERRMKKQ